MELVKLGVGREQIVEFKSYRGLYRRQDIGEVQIGLITFKEAQIEGDDRWLTVFITDCTNILEVESKYQYVICETYEGAGKGIYHREIQVVDTEKEVDNYLRLFKNHYSFKVAIESAHICPHCGSKHIYLTDTREGDIFNTYFIKQEVQNFINNGLSDDMAVSIRKKKCEVEELWQVEVNAITSTHCNCEEAQKDFPF